MRRERWNTHWPIELTAARARWLVAVATALAVTSAAFLLGNLLGIATPLPQAAPTSPAPAERAAEQPAGPGGSNGAAAVTDPVALPEIAPVALSQPFTGPGRPPLPMTDSGPYGTRRTTGAGYAALTFDDGPDPRWTPQVLALLREYDVRATFCVVGQLVEAHPQLLQEIATDGHTLCNHSWSHDIGLGQRSRAIIRDDMERTNAAIRAAVPGARISYYRQPGGAWSDQVVKVAAELGMSSLHWAVDPQDWRQPGAGAIASAVSAGIDDGAIVLLHDGGGERADTVQALGRLLPELTAWLQFEALPPGVDLPRWHGRELVIKPGQR